MKKLPSGTERGNNDKAFVGGIRTLLLLKSPFRRMAATVCS
jgi:hypothetical protein